MSTFNTLREANAARQAEWDKDARISLSYRGNELAGEIGEACNVIKKLERERLGIRGSRATVEQLAEELADGVICIDLIAMMEGIDLDAAVATKFNATSEKVGLETRLAQGGVLREIAAERARQVSAEGWSHAHDDGARCGELALGAAAYAVHAAHTLEPTATLASIIQRLWPWRWTFWKPKAARQDLVRAAALIVAEIERLDRAKAAA